MEIFLAMVQMFINTVNLFLKIKLIGDITVLEFVITTSLIVLCIIVLKTISSYKNSKGADR